MSFPLSSTKLPSGKDHRVVLVIRFFTIMWVKKFIMFLHYYDLSEDMFENPILYLYYSVVGTTELY